MKIYVASSWRNDQQPDVVAVLREQGHDVYDFKNPAPGDDGFHWSEIDLAAAEYLLHVTARKSGVGYEKAMELMVQGAKTYRDVV